MSQFLKDMWIAEERILKRNEDLVRLIKRVPHLDLGLDLDLDLLIKESKTLNDFHPHKLHPDKQLPSDYYAHHEFSFQGACLHDYVKDDVIGMSDAPGFLCQEPEAQFEGFKTRFFETPAGEKMPYLMRTLKGISPFLNRTRLIKTPPGGGIPWHSHHKNVYQINHLRLCVLNIPLVTNPKCMHGVRDHSGDESEEHWLHYQAGKAYLFNSWHDHSFWNQGQSDRVTIIPYFNFADQALLDFLGERLENYSGPLLPDS